MVTVQFGLQKSGLNLTDFAQEYVDRGRAEKSNVATRWLMGEIAIRARHVSRLDRMIPGTGEIYRHPVFQLLRYPALGSRQIRSLLRRYQNPRKPAWPYWWFGDEKKLGWMAPLPREETSTIWQRGDLDGFTNWTYFSPAPFTAPGQRTGRFRLGRNELVTGADGHSRIWFECRTDCLRLIGYSDLGANAWWRMVTRPILTIQFLACEL